MSRINTNIQSLIAQRNLGQNNKALDLSLERLSTGLRINRGKDDPAGLIASENLRSEKASINAAISNAERADQVANIAEGGLQEVSSLLTELQGLITNTANDTGLSDDEKKANQLQIDSILQTIDRIAGATSFQGKKLLNGNLDYTTTSVDSGVEDFRVNGAKLAYNGDIDVKAIVTTSAQQAGLVLSTNGALNLNNGVNSAFTIEITGTLGSRQLQFASGTTAQNIIDAINTFTDVTGVEAASITGTSSIKLSSEEFGSNEFVSVRVVDDANIQGSGVGIYTLESQDFNTADTSSVTAFNSTTASNGVRDTGQDVVATINGIVATADGKTARINSDFLDVSITLDTTTAQARGTVDAFTITGGGAKFQLAGNVDIAGNVSIGISDIATRKLGNTTLGYLSDLSSGNNNNVVDGDLNGAQKIVSEAINQVSGLRGRLGAFQKNTVGATIRSLSVSLENTTAAESSIRDANFATETAALTRNQILVSASTQILSLANQQPQAALQLLG
ncbi:MAG: flagellin [Phycisphaerales bacterium]|nr:flagellin [Phycisphaerales bacterium]